MLKKKWVKTGLAALLFSCLSVGAFADMQYVRVSDFYDQYGNTGTINELCVIHANNLEHPFVPEGFTYTGSWEWSTYPGSNVIRCILNNNVYWESVGVYPKCPNGGSIDKERLGCYELQEVEEPDPCLTRSGEGCVDPCEGKGIYTNARGEEVADYGGQACRDGNIVKACVWPDNFLETNARAKEIIRDCVLEHEEQHMQEKDEHQYCNDIGQGSANGRANWENQDDARYFECDGYIKEALCLQGKIKNNACNNDAECNDQIKGRFDEVFKFMNNRTCSVDLNSNTYNGHRYYLYENLAGEWVQGVFPTY